MSLLSILINDDGQHWDKEIRIFGILIYHRHDHTQNTNTNKQIGFTAGQYCSGEILDE